MDRSDGIRILIADDHTIFRTGVRSLLDAERDFVVVGEAGTGEEAVRMSQLLGPDILLLDVAMPGASGVDALRALATASCPVRAILLTAGIENAEIVKALRLGAAGVVLKASPPEVLVKSIRSVMSGRHWIGGESFSGLAEALRHYTEAPLPHARFGLTPRQLQITSAVVSGFSNKEIAKKFVLSEDTVKHHLTNIFDKVGASNRLELALFALHHRLLDEQDPLGK
jgi:two-component system nitrate/nitrite response regulator NarL